jgi:hypothetical protein
MLMTSKTLKEYDALFVRKKELLMSALEKLLGNYSLLSKNK